MFNIKILKNVIFVNVQTLIALIVVKKYKGRKELYLRVTWCAMIL
jgi:hypothetical protein